MHPTSVSYLKDVDVSSEEAELSESTETNYTLTSTPPLERVIGSTTEMKKMLQLVDKVAYSHASTVLLQGESGTGKNSIARLIHQKSKRAHLPFVEINCASLPENLIESELFGHEKGSFTDAKATKKGLFEIAQGGTIFLDEIAEMSLTTQAKLLHIIESHSFRRIGGTQSLTSQARVLAATSTNLKQAVREKKFREDLYYRLQLITVEIPSLRDRIEDVPFLINQFIHRFNKDYEKNILGVQPEAMKRMLNYSWPGNVRELKNVIERIAILEDDTMVTLSHLPEEICEETDGFIMKTQWNPETIQALGVRKKESGTAMNLEDMEKNYIVEALKKTSGNQCQAAKLLGVTRHTLRYRMEKFGLSQPLITM